MTEKTTTQEQIKKISEDKGWDIDAMRAYLDIGNDNFDNFEEAYRGEWDSDEDFVQNLLEDIGTIPSDLPVYIHINWEATARDIIMDYSEENGYYFRNL